MASFKTFPRINGSVSYSCNFRHRSGVGTEIYTFSRSFSSLESAKTFAVQFEPDFRADPVAFLAIHRTCPPIKTDTMEQTSRIDKLEGKMEHIIEFLWEKLNYGGR